MSSCVRYEHRHLVVDPETVSIVGVILLRGECSLQMTEFVQVIIATPIPKILILAGIGFMLLAVVETIFGWRIVGKWEKLGAALIGMVLLGLGLVLQTSTNGEQEWQSPLKLHPSAQASFNCKSYWKKPKDKRLPQSDVICAFADTADADRRMGSAYKKLTKARPEQDRAEIRDDQLKWQANRNSKCSTTWRLLEVKSNADKTAECLRVLTLERAEYLNNQADET